MRKSLFRPKALILFLANMIQKYQIMRIVYFLFCCWVISTENQNTSIYSFLEGISLDGNFYELQMSEDNKYLYVGLDDGVTILRKNNSFEKIQTLESSGHYGYRDIDVTADGKWLVWVRQESPASVYAMNQAGLYEVAQELAYPAEASPGCIAITDDHGWLAVGTPKQVDVFAFRTGKFEHTQTIGVAANSLAFSPHGELLLVGGYNSPTSWLYHLYNSLYLLNQTLDHPHNSFIWADLCDDSSLLVLGNYMQNYFNVYTLQAEKWEVQQVIETSSWVRRPSLSKDCRWMGLGQEGLAAVYRQVEGDFVREFDVSIQDGSNHAVKVSGNGASVAVGTHDTLHVYTFSQCHGFTCASCCEECSPTPLFGFVAQLNCAIGRTFVKEMILSVESSVFGFWLYFFYLSQLLLLLFVLLDIELSRKQKKKSYSAKKDKLQCMKQRIQFLSKTLCTYFLNLLIHQQQNDDHYPNIRGSFYQINFPELRFLYFRALTDTFKNRLKQDYEYASQ